jgi:putative flippase GtrA
MANGSDVANAPSPIGRRVHGLFEFTSTALRFGMVGITATVVSLVVAMSVCVGFGTSAVVGNAASFVVAFWVSYFGHNYFTYRRNGQHMHYGPRFALGSLGVFAFMTGVTAFAENILGFDSRMVVAGTAVLYPLVSFATSQFWAFRETR